MFGRSPARDGDVVDAAQRRLAALAAHHEQTTGARLDGTGADDFQPMAREPIFISAGTLSASEPDESGKAVGRHLGVRRAWFERLWTARTELGRSQLGRWGITAQHVTVAVLCVVALVVGVAWWALRSVPHTESVPVSSQRLAPGDALVSSPGPSLATPPTTPGGVATASSPVATGRIVVDVAGKVLHPGIVELPAGSRVVDAIDAAGGPRAGVALTSLNLARVLVDGEQIVVGIDVPALGGLPPPAGATSSTDAVTPVNLNTATAEQLDTLPGVGPVTAQAILQWRSDNGAFTDIDDLLEVSGIGSATLSDLRPYVYV